MIALKGRHTCHPKHPMICPEGSLHRSNKKALQLVLVNDNWDSIAYELLITLQNFIKGTSMQLEIRATNKENSQVPCTEVAFYCVIRRGHIHVTNLGKTNIIQQVTTI
jgi:hypothetical protein